MNGEYLQVLLQYSTVQYYYDYSTVLLLLVLLLLIGNKDLPSGCGGANNPPLEQ